MEKSALHRLSLSGEGSGARGVVACLPQSYFNVGWERKAHQARPACAKADAESLGGTQGLRLVGSVQKQAAGCQQGMLSAVLGALCWLQEQLPGCPWPCVAHTQQVILQGGQEPVVLVEGSEGFVPAAGVEFPGIIGLCLWWSEECWGC